MAKANLQNIATSGTFQNWFDKTNEIVNIIKTDTLTAGGDTTNGNAILAGNFTATNVIANTLLQTDGIGPKTGGATIQVNADTKNNLQTVVLLGMLVLKIVVETLLLTQVLELINLV